MNKQDLKCIAVVLVSMMITVIVGSLIMRAWFAPSDGPVCHSATEDSVIVDCDYRNGGWYSK
jgi:hypothetical protein